MQRALRQESSAASGGLFQEEKPKNRGRRSQRCVAHRSVDPPAARSVRLPRSPARAPRRIVQRRGKRPLEKRHSTGTSTSAVQRVPVWHLCSTSAGASLGLLGWLCFLGLAGLYGSVPRVARYRSACRATRAAHEKKHASRKSLVDGPAMRSRQPASQRLPARHTPPAAARQLAVPGCLAGSLGGAASPRHRRRTPGRCRAGGGR